MEELKTNHYRNENHNLHFEEDDNNPFCDLIAASLSTETKKKIDDRLDGNYLNDKKNLITFVKEEGNRKPHPDKIKQEDYKSIIEDPTPVKKINETKPDIKKHDISFNSELDSNLINLERLFIYEELNSNQNYNEIQILKSNKHKFNSLNNLVFNILVTGESGSGKTLFVKNFLKKISKNIKNSNSQQKSKFNVPSRDEFIVYDSEDKLITESDIHIGVPTKEFVEYKVNSLNMTKNNIFKIIDSPGYSGTRDSQTIANKVVEYINEKNRRYYNYKIKSNQHDDVQDCRIHLVLYFIYGPKPRMMDYLIIKELQHNANVIPVISRGDNLGREGIIKIKSEISNFQQNYEIEIFNVKETIKNFCKIDQHFNFLIGGKYGDSPPYFINYTNSFEENYYDIPNYDDSDFIRLYYSLVSYIPFDCITQTKKRYYKNFKITLEKAKKEKDVSKRNCNYIFALIAIPLVSAAVTIFKKNKN